MFGTQGIRVVETMGLDYMTELGKFVVLLEIPGDVIESPWENPEAEERAWEADG